MNDIDNNDLGCRVVVRRLIGYRNDRPQFTDLLGELVEVSETALTVRTAKGAVAVPLSEVHRAKVVPPRRGVTAREIAALERAATAAWPAPVVEHLGEWRLRAADGFTGRANSALPLGDPGMPIPQALAAVRDFYHRHGLPPQIDVPLPLAAHVEREILKEGWEPLCSVLVLAVDLDELIANTGTGEGFVHTAAPSEQALALIAGQRGTITPAARHVLTAVDQVTFAELYDDSGALLTRARGAVTDHRLGVFSVETVPAARRRGLAREAMGSLARWAKGRAATQAYLQVESTNAAAVALYQALSFTRHHHYTRYRSPHPR